MSDLQNGETTMNEIRIVLIGTLALLALAPAINSHADETEDLAKKA